MIKLSPLSLGPTDPKITPDEFVHGTVLREEEKKLSSMHGAEVEEASIIHEGGAGASLYPLLISA